jgi:hypothetical protein
MNTKLTLSIDQKIIERSKAYAKNTGRSLSELVEKYLASLTSSQDSTPSMLKSIVGVASLPKDFDEKAAREKAIREKHLK